MKKLAIDPEKVGTIDLIHSGIMMSSPFLLREFPVRSSGPPDSSQNREYCISVLVPGTPDFIHLKPEDTHDSGQNTHNQFID